MMKKIVSMTLVFLVCAACTACRISSRQVFVDGEMCTQTYQPEVTADGPYHIVIEDLILTGDASIVIEPSDEPYAEVVCPQKMLDYGFSVVYEDETIRVGTNGSNLAFRCGDFSLTIHANYNSITCNGGFEIDVDASGVDRLAFTANGAVKGTVHDLDASYADFAIAGAADLRVDGNIEDFSLSLSGAGKLVLDGTSDTFAAEINGAGKLDGAAFTVREAALDIRGIGSGVIGVSETLSAHVAGGGSIRYFGDPKQVNSSVAGAGSILPAE